MSLTFAFFYLNVLTWAQSNALIISTIGALIIFFSWVVTNTLGQRYSRLKSSVESAQSTFRLYTKLNELRNSLNSLAMEVVQNKNSVDASIMMPGRTGDADHDRVRTRFDLTRLSAHQIKELMDFTVETHSFSRVVGNTTESSRNIDSLLKEVSEMYNQLMALEREVEKTWQSGNVSPEKFNGAADKYITFVRTNAIPHVPHLYQAIVTASNGRNEEGRARLADSKRRFERSGKAALLLYILGSILALSGQYFDKTKPKTQEAVGVQQKS